jgi:hypothetical protein
VTVLEDLGLTFKETTSAVSYRIIKKYPDEGEEANSLWLSVYGPVSREMAMKLLDKLVEHVKESAATNWPADWPE